MKHILLLLPFLSLFTYGQNRIATPQITVRSVEIDPEGRIFIGAQDEPGYFFPDRQGIPKSSRARSGEGRNKGNFRVDRLFLSGDGRSDFFVQRSETV